MEVVKYFPDHIKYNYWHTVQEGTHSSEIITIFRIVKFSNSLAYILRYRCPYRVLNTRAINGPNVIYAVERWHWGARWDFKFTLPAIWIRRDTECSRCSWQHTNPLGGSEGNTFEATTIMTWVAKTVLAKLTAHPSPPYLSSARTCSLHPLKFCNAVQRQLLGPPMISVTLSTLYA